MRNQNYKNHKSGRKDFFTYTIYSSLLLIIMSIVYACLSFGLQSFIIFLLTLFIGVVLVAAKTIANKNQDRIIRMEMRFRYYLLTNKRFEAIENQLSMRQIVALRFASDEELLALIERTIQEKLTPDTIKQEIKNWLGDYYRV
jgi:hypothetical protein